MRVEIILRNEKQVVDGNEVEVPVKKNVELKIKGKDQREFLSKLKELMKAAQTESPDTVYAMEEFMQYQDEVIVKNSNITKEEMEELLMEELTKLRKTYMELVLPGKGNFF